MKRIYSNLYNNTFKQVYVLKLHNNKYYVGESTNIDKRIDKHFNNKGSFWTRKYPPLEILKPIIPHQNHFWELTETLHQMNIHGIDNVRGSLFTKEIITKSEKIMAAQLFCELNNYCRKCGRKDHFINQCNYDNTISWVNNFGGNLNFNH
tara:strand:- start:8 stop:457 length:450 start_codon:yes stop_codon:yes gene_type:complete